MIANLKNQSSTTTHNTRKSPNYQAKTPLPEELTLLTVCETALLQSLLKMNVHKVDKKIAQQTIGCKMSRYRRGKITPRPYVNKLIRSLAEKGIISHWGYYEDSHWYTIADKYKAFFTELAYQQKLADFEQLSFLHSSPQSTDTKKLTLYIYLNSAGELRCSERKITEKKNDSVFVSQTVLESLAYEPRDEDAALRYKMACKETLLAYKNNIEDIMAMQEASDLADGYVEDKGYDPFETEYADDDSINLRFKHFPDIKL